jgi:hypothetical protein
MAVRLSRRSDCRRGRMSGKTSDRLRAELDCDFDNATLCSSHAVGDVELNRATTSVPGGCSVMRAGLTIRMAGQS